MKTLRQMILFGFFGGIGYLVDVTVLYLVMAGPGLGYYSGRVVSFLCAATTTWGLNARFNFHDRRRHRSGREWLLFISLNLPGGLINYGVYALLIHQSALMREWPMLAVAIGSVAGMVPNFLVTRWVVFPGSADAAKDR